MPDPNLIGLPVGAGSRVAPEADTMHTCPLRTTTILLISLSVPDAVRVPVTPATLRMAVAYRVTAAYVIAAPVGVRLTAITRGRAAGLTEVIHTVEIMVSETLVASGIAVD